mgnify:CR=1 FL=1
MLLAHLTACQKEIPQAKLETALDTLAYCIGAGNAIDRTAMGGYLESVGSDSTHINDFLQGLYVGLTEGAEAYESSTADAKARAYNQGINVGQQMLQRPIANAERLLQLGDSTHLSREAFAAGFADYVLGSLALRVDGNPATREWLSETARSLMERIGDERAEKLYGKEKRAGLDYIAKKATEPGVRPLGEGVYYKELQAGHGDTPTLQSTVRVRYEGRFINDKVFDATANHGINEYDEFPVSGVIKGWQQALTQMPVGSKWEVYIPYDQAYGAAGNPPDMPPYSTLIFTMELLEIL